MTKEEFDTLSTKDQATAAERVVEYSAVDVLTGHVVAWIAKPVRARDDGTRETLRGLCDVGITEAGCLIMMGEHGTATLDASTAEMLYRETALRRMGVEIPNGGAK